MDTKYTYTQFSEEEGKVVLEKFNTFLDENSMNVVAEASLSQDGRIIIKSVLYKKILKEPVIDIVPPTKS